MATRAERFRADQQTQSTRPTGKKPKPSKPEQVSAATNGVSGAGKASRNFKNNPKQGAALELSDGATPSRKSTRSSAGRLKQATQLTRRQTRRVSSPKARATRSSARS